MAWTEQCRLQFYTNCKGKVDMSVGRKRVSMADIFREMSQESDIPANTLKRWWTAIEAERKRFNNEPPINDENNSENSKHHEQVCIGCNQDKSIYKDSKTGNPYSQKSIYYGLCTTCFSIKKKNRTHGVKITCPHCNKQFRTKEAKSG